MRIIPRLDIKGPNLVKGIHLEGLRALGRPENFARYYYEQGADELIYMDVVASLYERNSLHDIIRKTAREIHIPLTVGGGIRTLEDIKNVLRVGADKISINTAAIRDPQFIKEASEKFGSSTIVVAIEAIKQPDGKYLAFVDNGREFTGIEVVKWAQEAVELGAGEILVTSVDNEGTAKGFDEELTTSIVQAVSVPVIAHGGAGAMEHILNVVHNCEPSAVSIASILHYDAIKEFSLDTNNQSEGNFDFIRSGNRSSRLQTTTITAIKDLLIQNNLECRP